MGVKIEVLFTKDTPYGDMLEKIEELAKEHMEPWLVPVPFLERIIGTRGLTVIQYAIDDFIKIFERDDTASIKDGDMKRLKAMLGTNKLDEVWVIAHEMCAESDRNPDVNSRVAHRQEAQRIQDFLNKHTPAKNSVSDLNAQERILSESIATNTDKVQFVGKFVDATELRASFDVDGISELFRRRNHSIEEFFVAYSMRRELPYGKWTCGNGREVLFNREYQPILQRLDGVTSHCARTEWIHDIVSTEMYYDDGSAPWYAVWGKMNKSLVPAHWCKAGELSLKICLKVLKGFKPKETPSESHQWSIHDLLG